MHTWLILGSSRFCTLTEHFGKMNINCDKENSYNKKNEPVSWEIEWFLYSFSIENQRACQEWKPKSNKNHKQDF